MVKKACTTAFCDNVVVMFPFLYSFSFSFFFSFSQLEILFDLLLRLVQYSRWHHSAFNPSADPFPYPYLSPNGSQNVAGGLLRWAEPGDPSWSAPTPPCLGKTSASVCVFWEEQQRDLSNFATFSCIHLRKDVHPRSFPSAVSFGNWFANVFIFQKRSRPRNETRSWSAFIPITSTGYALLLVCSTVSIPAAMRLLGLFSLLSSTFLLCSASQGKNICYSFLITPFIFCLCYLVSSLLCVIYPNRGRSINILMLVLIA